MDSSIATLQHTIARFTGDSINMDTDIPGLTFHRRDAPSEPTSGLYDPSICIVAQGVKKAIVGNETYVYNKQHFLITSMHLPTLVQIVEASKSKPYLGLVLRFDRRKLSQIMADNNLPIPRVTPSGQGLSTYPMTYELSDAFQRMVNLLNEPESIPTLAPLIHQEIIYRLLTGESGPRLRHVAAAGSHSNQIALAVEWLRTNFTKPLQVGKLAEYAGMSTSTFHHHFRVMTALSPLQYQKRLRLHEARNLMLTEHLDASTAAFQVGYESSSQFSREYSRHFGAPPLYGH